MWACRAPRCVCRLRHVRSPVVERPDRRIGSTNVLSAVRAERSGRTGSPGPAVPTSPRRTPLGSVVGDSGKPGWRCALTGMRNMPRMRCAAARASPAEARWLMSCGFYHAGRSGGYAAPAIPYYHPAYYATSYVAECMSVMLPPSGSRLVCRGQAYPVIRGRRPML
jgi:hypothetical protein